MTKAELLEQMATDAGISKTAASAALNSLVGNITMALKKRMQKLHWSDLVPFQNSAKSPQRAKSPNR